MAPNDIVPNNANRQTGELAVHCAHCGHAVTLFLDLNPTSDRPNQECRDRWLCVWCGTESSIGLDGDIGAVVKGHATESLLTATAGSETRHEILSLFKAVTVTVPVFCQHCGKGMFLAISRGPLGDERDEVNPVTQPQRWACAWCQVHNDRVFFGWLLEVRKNEQYRGDWT